MLLKQIIIKLTFSAVALLLSYIIPINIINVILITFASVVLLEETVRKVIDNFKKRKIFSFELILCITSILCIFLREFQTLLIFLIFYFLNKIVVESFLTKNKNKIIEALDYRNEEVDLKTVAGVVKAKWKDLKVGDEFILKENQLLCVDAICLSDSVTHTLADNYETAFFEEEVLSGNFIQNEATFKVKTDYQNSIYYKMIYEMKTTSDTKIVQVIEKIEKKYYTFLFTILILFSFILLFFKKLKIEIILLRFTNTLSIFSLSSLTISISFFYFMYLLKCKNKQIYFTKKNIIEKLKSIQTVIFTKRGILTKEHFEVSKIIPVYETKEEVLKMAAYIEKGSNHEMAKAILRAYKKEIDEDKIYHVEDIKGMGRKGIIEDKEVYIGTKLLFDTLKINYPKVDFLTPTCMLAIDGTYVGTFVFTEEVKESAYLSSSLLREQGVEKIVLMSSGEVEQIKKIGNRLSMNESYAYLSLSDKQKIIEMYEKEKRTMYIDAFEIPSILDKKASLSVLYKGSNADIVFLDDDLKNLSYLKEIGNHLFKYSLIILISYFLLKFILFLFAIFGIMNLDMITFIELIYIVILSNVLLSRIH